MVQNNHESESVQCCGSLEKCKWLNHHTGLSLDDVYMLGRVTGLVLALCHVQVQKTQNSTY